MSEGGFIKRMFGRLCGAGAAAEQPAAPSEPTEAGEANPVRVDNAQTAAEPPHEATDEQGRELQEAMERLAHLPRAMQELAGAVKAQVDLNEKLQEVLAGLSEPNPDLLHAMQDLAAESQKQTDLLQTMQAKLAERSESDVRTNEAVARLPDLLERINHSNASHIELMEQMRDRWANAKDDIAQELVRQGWKMTTLMGIVIGLLIALIVAVVFAGLVR